MPFTEFMTPTRKTAGLNMNRIDSSAIGRMKDFSVEETI